MPFAGAFAKLRKTNISFIMSVCPSVRPSVRPHGTTRLPLTELREIWYLSIFRKSVKEIQVLVKSDKNNGHFTWKPIYVFDHFSLSFSQNWKRFRQTLKRKSNTRFMLYNFFFFRKLYRLWDNVEKCSRAWQATDEKIAQARCMPYN